MIGKATGYTRWEKREREKEVVQVEQGKTDAKVR